MFRKTRDEKQLDIFGNAMNYLENSSTKVYTDENYWHNQFYKEVVLRIDENLFSRFYSDGMGAPNASIKVLIGMMLMKEAFGWSDSQLYEQCQFNLLVRSALGLVNINDKLPVLSTYYLLRQKVHSYEKETGEDLFAEVFKIITSNQIKEFNVNGRSIRMDSKLIGSNIALYSRYEIIIQTIQLYYNKQGAKIISKLSKKDRQNLTKLVGEDPQKTVYHNTKQEIQSSLREVGLLIYKLLQLDSDNQTQKYQLLQRVFEEQYRIGEECQIELRGKEQISSSSIQSPHDPDSAYRNKGGNKIKGYSTNLTETCSQEGLNLITSVLTEPANTADTKFVEQAIKETVQITDQEVQKAYMDGAYQSPDNDESCKGIDMVYTGIQGGESRYELEMTVEGLLVTDTHTGEQQIAQSAKKQKQSNEDKYRIKTTTGYRYFNHNAIRTSQLRRQMKHRSEEELKLRNNVESTVHHLCYPLKSNKTRYRGLFKHRMWAYLRGLWVNFVRILKFKTQKSKEIRENSQNSLLSLVFALVAPITNVVMIIRKKKYRPIFAHHFFF